MGRAFGTLRRVDKETRCALGETRAARWFGDLFHDTGPSNEAMAIFTLGTIRSTDSSPVGSNIEIGQHTQEPIVLPYNVNVPELLLQTKLYIPSLRPSLVSRPQIIEKLDAGLGGKLTLVSAAAGFGKTTIISDWVKQLNRPVGWLSLDSGDNDPIRFWSYTFAALQGARAELGEGALEALNSPQPPPIETLLTNLINQATSLGDKVILVLDDYHSVENHEIHRAITFLLKHLPPQLHLVIVGRSDPPLNLARMRGFRQLTELREVDLRFTIDETESFFLQAAKLQLSSDSVTALHRRTEGWVVGLQLTGLAMQGREDTAKFIDAFAGEHMFITDYLTEEIFNQQSESVQNFLLGTSILDRMNSRLCDAVLGVDGKSQRTLEYLDQHNLFLVSLDDRRFWYRYHHLFADMLRYRLQQAEPNQVKELHRKAGAWYAGNGFVDEALAHLFAAEDWENAVLLIESVAPDMIGLGRITLLLEWIGSLPNRIVSKHPYLCIYHAWVLVVTNQVDELESRIQDAESALSAREYDNYVTADIQGQIAAIRAYDARRRKDLARAIDYHRKALALLPEDNGRARSASLFHLGLTYLHQKRLLEAADTLSQARLLGEPGGNLYVTLAATGFLADILVAQGKLQQAAEMCHQTIDDSLTRYPKESAAGLAYVQVSLGRILYEWNDLENAAAYLMKGIEKGEQTGNWRATILGMAALAWLRRRQGNDEEAGELLLKAASLSDRAHMSFREMELAVWKARFALEDNDKATVRRWSKGYQLERSRSGTSHEFSDLMLVRTLIAQGQTTRALELLAQFSAVAESAEANGWLIELLILKALAYHVQSENKSALTSLELALSLARPNGYIRTFVDEGPALSSLLTQLAMRLGHGEALQTYAMELFAAFPESQTHGVATMTTSAKTLVALNDRECQVLRLLAAGFKTPEIASELHLANSTIKWHLRNIYSKLDVHRRADAIAKARELKLL